MAKSSKSKRQGAEKLTRPDKLNIDLTRFKPDITSGDLKNLLTPVKLANVNLIIFPTIEVISPVKTVGLGRTNLTVVRPVIFQTDATPPHVAFNLSISTAQQPPTVSVHFEPSKYGLMGNAAFVISFSIKVDGTATFNVGAFAGSGTASGTGTRTVTGQRTVSITYQNVPATQQVFGHISQTAGTTWQWFLTRISYLPILISP